MRTAEQITTEINSGKLTAVEAVERSLLEMEKWEPHLNAFSQVLAVEARAQAEKVEQSTGEKLLKGVPVAVKDVICTVEGKTSAASQMLKNFSSPFDATVVKRLREQGAIVVGKANCDEFAMGSSNEHSAYGPVKNPWDRTRVAGGSSGGSAAAVASGEVPLALGSDTGGSIRLPAGFCGVVGLKPTYGRVSRFGLIAYASSFDQIGPLGRTVKDVALLLEVMAGLDPLDATSSSKPVGAYRAACNRGVKGLRIGVPKEYFAEDVDPAISATIRTALDVFRRQGAELVDISLPLMQAAVPTYYLLVKAEASTNLARFDGLRYGELELEAKDLIERYLEARGKYFGPEVKRSILMGTYALSAGYVEAWYKQASRVRTLIRREFEDAFGQVDLIAGPVSTEVAFKLGEKIDDPLAMYLADLLTDPASVAGLPALSVPAGIVEGLPVGLQLISSHFGEEVLMQAGHSFQQESDWHTKTPQL